MSVWDGEARTVRLFVEVTSLESAMLFVPIARDDERVPVASSSLSDSDELSVNEGRDIVTVYSHDSDTSDNVRLCDGRVSVEVGSLDRVADTVNGSSRESELSGDVEGEAVPVAVFEGVGNTVELCDGRLVGVAVRL